MGSIIGAAASIGATSKESPESGGPSRTLLRHLSQFGGSYPLTLIEKRSCVERRKRWRRLLPILSPVCYKPLFAVTMFLRTVLAISGTLASPATADTSIYLRKNSRRPLVALINPKLSVRSNN